MKIGTTENGKAFTLPADAATETFAFIGRKGTGKTYASGVLVEQLIEAGVQVIILDSVGNWWGLRFASDGKTPGIDIPILGGLRGDIPLEQEGGALIADTVVETGRSMILDVSQFSKSARQRFATAFAEQLWQRKKGETHPSPVHLVIEESQLIVPEQVGKDQARMVGAYEEIIRLGRNYGVGVTMITQRPQSVNKEVLNLTECLVVGQVNGPHERKALTQWIAHQGLDRNLANELPSLKRGTMYVWSPSWLDVLERVQIAAKWTFDSTATPKPGAARVRRDPKPIDLKDLQERMRDAIERKKADDPKELRREIADLKRRLAAQKPAETKIETRVVEKPVLTDKQVSALVTAAAKLAEIAEKITVTAKPVREFKSPQAVTALVKKPTHVITKNVITRPVRPEPSTNGDITGPERRILNALAWWRAAGIERPSREQVAFVARYTPSSGGFNNPLGALRTKGYVDYPMAGTVALTADGTAHAEQPDAAVDRDALLAAVRSILPGPELRILDALLELGGPVSREDLAGKSSYVASSGGFNNPLGRLRTLGIVDYPQPGMVDLSEHVKAFG